MIVSRSERLARLTVLLAALLTLSQSDAFWSRPSQAQSTKPILFSHEDSTRAIAVNSVTRTLEPFAVTEPIAFGADTGTRVMLFAGNLSLQDNEGLAAVTADAEDESHHIFPLPVEYVGPVPDQNWATAVVLKLNQEMNDAGDVLVR